MSNGADRPSLTRAFRVTEARSRDVGRNIARLDPQDLEVLGLSPGQAIEIVGRRRTVAVVMPSLDADRQPQTIQIDGLTRGNADVDLDEQVTVRPIDCAVAERITLAPASRWDDEHIRGIEKYLGKLLDNLVAVEGDLIRLSPFGISAHDFKVLECHPAGPVRVNLSTTFEVVERAPTEATEQLLVYEDIGGLKQEVQRLREMVEVPLKHPEIFERLGVVAPRAILLSGPAGAGKSLMARVVAEAAQAQFLATSGPEILNKYYHHEKMHLHDLFERAVARPPAVIFIDELERIASQQCLAATEAEKYIATELLTLLDRLERNGRVVVIGSTTSPDDIDPTFRRHGRFEREIDVQPPNHKDRREILEIHSRSIPLAEDVDLDQLAALTQGFVGADLSILCQEAAFIALRQKMIETGYWGQPSFEMLAGIRVTMAHFLEALRTITPSLAESATSEFAEASWEDIGGLQEVREQLMEAVIRPLQSPQLFTRVRARPVRGVLLHGPPGTGKTLLARALAKETGITFIPVKATDLIMGDVNLCEQMIRDIFGRARRMAPSIIFLDEIDALSPTEHRSDTVSQAERALRQLLSQIDGIEQLRGLVVLGATNRLEAVDPALFEHGRFDLLLEVPLPDSEALKEIFQIHLRHRPIADDVDLDVLVKLAGGFSGADVEMVCQMAANNAIKELVTENRLSQQDLLIAQRHLAAAIAERCKQKLD